MNKIKKIRNRWDIPASDMSEKNIEYLLKNDRGFVDNFTKKFLKTNTNYYYDEIYSIVLEGFYKAILAYNPDKGNLESYSFFYCKGHLKHHLHKNYKHKASEVSCDFIDSLADNREISEEDKLFLKEGFKKLSEEQREVLSAYSFANGKNIGNSITDCCSTLKISKYKFDKIMETSLEKMREKISA